MTRDPFKIEGPATISFSGGRTSAYMMRRIQQACGGALAKMEVNGLTAMQWSIKYGEQRADTIKAEAALARARDALMDFAAGCDDLVRNCGPEITKGEQRTWRAMAAKLRNAALKEP